eukprot:9480810-Pyramimonas_sp.AAC.1
MVEDSSFEQIGSRFRAADPRLKSLQRLQGLRASRFQSGALALVAHARLQSQSSQDEGPAI